LDKLKKQRQGLRSWRRGLGSIWRRKLGSIGKVENLLLKNGHYTLQKTEQFYKYMNYNEKNPVIWKTGDGCIECYDKKGYWTISVKKLYIDQQKFLSCPNIYIKQGKDHKDDSLKQTYEQFIKDATTLKKETDGVINMFKTGSVYDTARCLIDKFTKTIVVDPIEQDEAIFLQKATTGALMYYEKYEGPAYKYDLVSHYPSIMSDQHFRIPIKRGEFRNITKDEFEEETREFFRYGIYRCKVFTDDKKMFRQNNDNYYTHYDLTMAKKRGYKIELIEDGKPNCLLYSREKVITGYRMFHDYVKLLFDLKKKGITTAKLILNIIWGLMAQRNMRKTKCTTIEKDKNFIDISEDDMIDSIKPSKFGEDGFLLKLQETVKYYKYDHARIGPFLLAKGRERIAEVIGSYEDSLVRLHTDGFILKTAMKREHIDLGTDLGQLKYEGYCPNVSITNYATKSFEFKDDGLYN
jgi:hypothetical protein